MGIVVALAGFLEPLEGSKTFFVLVPFAQVETVVALAGFSELI